MLEVIRHRVNDIAALRSLATEWGAEVDIRSNPVKPGHLHLSHDPWNVGVDFRVWLDEFAREPRRGTLILNVKEDGLEEVILSELAKRSITRFFFLDCAMPTVVRFATRNRERRFAARLSSFEPVEGLGPLVGRVDWVWADCFGAIPIAKDRIAEASANFKVCLVAPELQGGATQDVSRFQSLLPHVRAVCTKCPELWQP